MAAPHSPLVFQSFDAHPQTPVPHNDEMADADLLDFTLELAAAKLRLLAAAKLRPLAEAPSPGPEPIRKRPPPSQQRHSKRQKSIDEHPQRVSTRRPKTATRFVPDLNNRSSQMEKHWLDADGNDCLKQVRKKDVPKKRARASKENVSEQIQTSQKHLKHPVPPGSAPVLKVGDKISCEWNGVFRGKITQKLKTPGWFAIEFEEEPGLHYQVHLEGKSNLLPWSWTD